MSHGTTEPDSSPLVNPTTPSTATGHGAVVGLQWGDEGKGKVVDLLTQDYDLVVRYNGGANAGHSVQVGDDRYALHLIPSGVLYPGKVGVLGNGLVIDPDKLIQETQGLTERGVDTCPNKLRISNRAHVVLSYHKIQDALLEAALMRASGEDRKIGTTGRGIGPCYADKALRSTAVRIGDLLDRERLAIKLRHVVTVKNAVLKALAETSGQSFEPFDPDQLADQYAGYGNVLREHICDTAELLHNAASENKRILFEGANASLLDVDHGTYPYVTSSNCSVLGATTGAGVPGAWISDVLGVLKAYTTRVGGGPMPTELHNDTGEWIRKRGKEFGTTTGRPRRCGWLDLFALRYTAAINGTTGVFMTMLDVLSGLETIQVCVGYQLDGQDLHAFPADADTLSRVQPVYQQVQGFDQPVDDCRTFGDLPSQARSYIALIEEHLGVPVRMIGVGPRRDQVILRPDPTGR